MDYHKDRFTDHSLLVFQDEKLIAVLPANITEATLHSHQGLTYGGLIYSEKLKFKVVLDIFKAILQYLHQQEIKLLNLKILPSIYTKIPNEELNYLMFLVEAKLHRRDALSVVNMSQKIKLSKDRVEGYKRGVKQNLVVKEVGQFDEFWNLILIPNLNTKHNTSPVHSLTEITTLKQNFNSQIRQFNVYKDDKIVAGTTIFETKHVAHSQYISGNNNKNELGSLDFLHHHLLTNIFKDKPYFDFGTSNENEGKKVNHGLQYWKEGFGARTIIQDFYSVDTKNFNKLNSVFI
ncbi:GNAT family N-acetyltransferase [Olleya sp. YS]|uniref:GNAT family N-acetyltransferase n=1 Tax=Olleya sp. YS TaxID=3028318 RepID=UPI00243442FA|nr:GNAT family N-acetyltransferase [Olleya sp. YS]WGD35144.1 GNAT family N-acetyltransferase [Olleya sp. YS]